MDKGPKHLKIHKFPALKIIHLPNKQTKTDKNLRPRGSTNKQIMKSTFWEEI